MKVIRETTKQRHQLVVQEITALQRKKVGGLKFSFDSIVEKVAKQFCLSPATVRDIYRKTKIA